MKSSYPSLFQPIEIGNLEIKNRLVLPPLGTLFCGSDGHPCDRLTAYHRVRAQGGWGLIIVEGVAIERRGKGGPKQYGIWDDSFIPEYRELVDAVHAGGAKIALQIMHCGRNTRPEINGGEQPVAPSAIPDPVVRVMPRELPKEEIAGIIESFVQASRRAKEAGFDAVEIHGGHGYLVAQFMSSYANRREDEYGGGFEGFIRFPAEIVRRIKKVLGREVPVIFRISADEAVSGGRTVEESARMSRRLAEEGVDAIHASVGVYESSHLTMAPAAVEAGFNVHAASVIKGQVNVPVIAVGKINSPDLAERIIRSGRADLVAIGRQSLADPFWPLKIKEDRTDAIVRCLSCNEGCLGRAWDAKPITCVQNPLVGLETRNRGGKSGKPRRVLVAGGGPAGLEGARIAALRGHQVILYEKEDVFGGQVRMAKLPPYKGMVDEVVRSRMRAMEELHVEMNPGKELTLELVKQISPDVLLVATGSDTLIPDIPGSRQKNVVTARDVLKGAGAGRKIVVAGGGMVGCETADWLSELGREVILVEMMKSVAKDISSAARFFLLKRLTDKRVRIMTEAKVEGIVGDRVILSGEAGESTISGVDTIVLATGARSVNDLEPEARGFVPEIHVIGDARRPGKILDAVRQAAEIWSVW